MNSLLSTARRRGQPHPRVLSALVVFLALQWSHDFRSAYAQPTSVTGHPILSADKTTNLPLEAFHDSTVSVWIPGGLANETYLLIPHGKIKKSEVTEQKVSTAFLESVACKVTSGDAMEPNVALKLGPDTLTPQPNGACRELFASTVLPSKEFLIVAPDGKTAFSARFWAPEDSWKKPVQVRKKKGADGKPELEPQPLPLELDADSYYYLWIANKLVRGTPKDNDLQAEHWALIKSALQAEHAVQLFAHQSLTGRWWKLEVEMTGVPDDSSRGTKPKPTALKLGMACDSRHEDLNSKLKKRGRFYLICIDLTRGEQVDHIVRRGKNVRDRMRTSGSGPIASGWPVIVHVWYPPDAKLKDLRFGGQPGEESPFNERAFQKDQQKEAPLLEQVEWAQASREFGSRLAGEANITVEFEGAKKNEKDEKSEKDGGDSTDASSSGRTATIELRVIRIYRGAARLGALTWFAPRSRTYELETGTSPNTGQVVTLADGPGRFGLDFAAGASWFVFPVREDSLDVSLELLGALSIVGDSPEDLDLLPALHGGFGLAIGPDFSVDFVVSMRRARKLRDGYAIGSYVESGKSPEDVSTATLIPSVGFLVNLSPAAWRFVKGGK